MQVNMDEREKFVISQKGLIIRDGKCLIMELNNHPGRWDLPGGRIDKGELSEEAFPREIKEETGISDFENLGVIGYSTWITPKEKIPICGIINLIKNDSDNIKLSEEHTKMKWILENEIDNYIFIWDCLPRIIKRGFLYKKITKENE